MKIVGLDLSLTATGVADWTGTYTISPPKTAADGMPRLDWLERRILDVTELADLVVIEGYSFGARRQSHTRAIAELGGVVRLALWRAGRPYVDVPPATLKKLSTGRGNAPKEEVLAAAIRRLGFEGHSKDEADALWLKVAALIHYGHPDAPDLPKTHLEGLGKVAWPELEA